MEVTLFGTTGVFPCPQGLMKGFRSFPQSVWVKDKVYMCMGPDVAHFRVDRSRLGKAPWAYVERLGRFAPSGPSACQRGRCYRLHFAPLRAQERAIATKHVLLNDTQTHVRR